MTHQINTFTNTKTLTASIKRISFVNSSPNQKNSIASSNNLSVVSNNNNCNKRSSLNSAISVQLKPHYSSVAQVANRASPTGSKNSNRILMLISLVFAILNLPYLVAWFIFYFVVELNFKWLTYDTITSTVQISEIIHLLNYALLFYVYCASGTRFRNQLKYSRKYSKQIFLILINLVFNLFLNRLFK